MFEPRSLIFYGWGGLMLIAGLFIEIEAPKMILPKLPLTIHFRDDCFVSYSSDVPHCANPAEWEADWYAAKIFYLAGLDLTILSRELEAYAGRTPYLPFSVWADVAGGMQGKSEGTVHTHIYYMHFFSQMRTICIDPVFWKTLPEHIKWFLLLHESYHVIHAR